MEVTELTDRQKLTIKHLGVKGITSPKDIISWCAVKLQQSRRDSHRKMYRKRRKHPKIYYYQILRFFKVMKKIPDVATVK